MTATPWRIAASPGPSQECALPKSSVSSSDFDGMSDHKPRQEGNRERFAQEGGIQDLSPLLLLDTVPVVVYVLDGQRL